VLAPPPLPEIPKALKPPRKPVEPAEPAADAPPARSTNKRTRAPKLSAEERQQQHAERARRGVLQFVSEKGGSAALREMHDYSESTFFVAHASFSRLMEELTDAKLLDFNHDEARATLTEAGRAALS
jgi:hypothetical protein